MFNIMFKMHLFFLFCFLIFNEEEPQVLFSYFSVEESHVNDSKININLTSSSCLYNSINIQIWGQNVNEANIIFVVTSFFRL